jgi:hypothetical protein
VILVGAGLTLLGAGSISAVGWYVWAQRGFSWAPESAQAGVCAMACTAAVLGAILVLGGGEVGVLALGSGVGFAGSGAVLAWAARPIARQASPETVEQLRVRLAELEAARAREWERAGIAMRGERAANWDRIERELGRHIAFRGAHHV